MFSGTGGQIRPFCDLGKGVPSGADRLALGERGPHIPVHWNLAQVGGVSGMQRTEFTEDFIDPVFPERGLRKADALGQQDGVCRDAIYFGGGEVDLPRPPWDIAFTIDRNVFRGHASLNISIKAVRAAESREG